MTEKIVLAYSGGLDTSVAVRWLQEKYGAEIATLTMDMGGKVHLERGFLTSAAALEERGHVIVTGTGVFGGYQAILRDAETGVYHGASESRKDGHAAGW